MYFRYHVLKALIEQEGLYSIFAFDASDVAETFPDQSTDLVFSCIHELKQENLVSFESSNGNTFYHFSVSPSAPAFLLNQKEVRQLKQREKWIERAYGYIAGVASAVSASLAVQWLQ